MSKNHTGLIALLIGLVTLFSTIASGQEKGIPAQASQQAGTPATSGGTRSASRTDAEIQSCIQGKLAASEKLRVQEFIVTVSNSEATFTGSARNAGSKGAATRIGQSCGAVKILNNITAPAIPRPAKPAEGRTSL
jgi:osmotically-inducible protein OsmY